MSHEPNGVVVVMTTWIPVHVLLNLAYVVRMRRSRKGDPENEGLIWSRKRNRNWSPIGGDEGGLGTERHDEESRQRSHDGSCRDRHVAFLEVIHEVSPTFRGAR